MLAAKSCCLTSPGSSSCLEYGHCSVSCRHVLFENLILQEYLAMSYNKSYSVLQSQAVGMLSVVCPSCDHWRTQTPWVCWPGQLVLKTLLQYRMKVLPWDW